MLGADKPDTLRSMVNLAGCLITSQQTAEGVALLNRAIPAVYGFK